MQKNKIKGDGNKGPELPDPRVVEVQKPQTEAERFKVFIQPLRDEIDKHPPPRLVAIMQSLRLHCEQRPDKCQTEGQADHQLNATIGSNQSRCDKQDEPQGRNGGHEYPKNYSTYISVPAVFFNPGCHARKQRC